MYKVLSYDGNGFMFCYYSTKNKTDAERYMKMNTKHGVKHVLEISD